MLNGLRQHPPFILFTNMQFWHGLARASCVCSMPQHSIGHRGSTTEAHQTPRTFVLVFGQKFSCGYWPSFFSMLDFLVIWELNVKSKPSRKPDEHYQLSRPHFRSHTASAVCTSDPVLIMGKEPPITSCWKECQSHIVREHVEWERFFVWLSSEDAFFYNLLHNCNSHHLPSKIYSSPRPSNLNICLNSSILSSKAQVKIRLFIAVLWVQLLN